MYYSMKRTFKTIRNEILKLLETKIMTKMEISRAINTDYRTIEKHLIWLLGTERVMKVERNKKVYYKLA